MQIDGQVCTISVDNVAKKNAYTPAMLDRLAELLTEYEDNDDLRPLARGAAAENRPGVTGNGVELRFAKNPRPAQVLLTFNLKQALICEPLHRRSRRCAQPAARAWSPGSSA